MLEREKKLMEENLNKELESRKNMNTGLIEKNIQRQKNIDSLKSEH